MDAAERTLQEAIADACLAEGAAEAMARDLRGFLASHGVEPGDIDAMLASPRRLAVYRALVRNGLSGVVARVLRRTRGRMNAACGGRFDADFARFVAEVGPRTHFLRDLPSELFAWVEPRWRSDVAVPAYLVDLAAHEIATFEVSAARDASPHAGAAATELAIDRALVFDASARRLHYGWAVHELPDDDGSVEAPARREVRLLGYRDRDHAVRWLELTPLAAAIVERLLGGAPIGRAVGEACAAHASAPEQVAGDVARLLADLAERGVIRAARRAEAGGPQAER
ncbi:MAG TPA: PqqD family peptide modification chaperone [Polyangiaceae bacterium]|nr:PqqD family peptide modification chaperone [Polyangiaceae bacterium]